MLKHYNINLDIVPLFPPRDDCYVEICVYYLCIYFIYLLLILVFPGYPHQLRSLAGGCLINTAGSLTCVLVKFKSTPPGSFQMSIFQHSSE